MKEDKPEPKILKREVITDQSDPRMVEFRESYGEFQPSCKRKTVRLEITEYEPGPEKLKVTTQVGYYEGEPPPGYKECFRKLCRAVKKEGWGFESPAPSTYTILAPKTTMAIWMHPKDYINSISVVNYYFVLQAWTSLHYASVEQS